MEGDRIQMNENAWLTPRLRRAVSRWWLLAVIALIAMGLRLWLVSAERVVWGDEPFYLWLGRNWITGQGFQFVGHPDVHHGPLFPMMAGLVYLLTGNLMAASNILYVVFGMLLALPLYGLGAELYGRRTGLIAAALTGVFPALSASVLHWGSLTEPIYLLFIYLGLWASVRLMRNWWPSETPNEGRAAPWWAFFLAGLFFGLAYLTRPEAVTYLAVVGAFLFVLGAVRGRLKCWRFWLGLAFYALAFSLCFLPYAYYVRLQTGAWMVSEKVGVAYLTGIGLAHGDTAAFDRSTWGLDATGLETFFFSSESYHVSMVSLILQDPRTFFSVVYLNLQTFVRTLIDWTLYPYVLLPLVALGLLAKGWTRERTLKEAFLLASILPVVSFLLFYIQARYLVPLVPLFVLWAALGLARLGDWLVGTLVELLTPDTADERQMGRPYWHMRKGWRSFLEALPTMLIMVGLVLAQPMVVDKVTSVGGLSMMHRQLGEELASQVAGATIMCRYPAIAFHADATWIPTPNADWGDVLPYARHKGVDYFVIDQRELRYRPQFTDLLLAQSLPPELELVRIYEAANERLVVYRLLD